MLLFPTENPDALAAAVVRLVDDAALRERLARALHERVVAEFAAEKTTAPYLAIYREVLHGTPRQRRPN